MLDIQVNIKGGKVITRNLVRFAGYLLGAIQEGLSDIVRKTHSIALKFLSGAGAKASNIAAGGYPVPRRAGHLARMLNFLEPGDSKSTEGLTFTAGSMEAVLYNSAEYGNIIHEGLGSSLAHGPRRYATDALTKFNKGAQIKKVMEEKVRMARRKAGLK